MVQDPEGITGGAAIGWSPAGPGGRDGQVEERRPPIHFESVGEDPAQLRRPDRQGPRGDAGPWNVRLTSPVRGLAQFQGSCASSGTIPAGAPGEVAEFQAPRCRPTITYEWAGDTQLLPERHQEGRALNAASRWTSGQDHEGVRTSIVSRHQAHQGLPDGDRLQAAIQGRSGAADASRISSCRFVTRTRPPHLFTGRCGRRSNLTGRA
jgi:hypothetical protein